MTVYSVMRVAGVAMALTITALLIIVNRRRVRAKAIAAPELLFRQGIGVYLIAGAWSTVELHRLGTPGGPRLILLTVGLLWMLIAIVQIERNQRKPK